MSDIRPAGFQRALRQVHDFKVDNAGQRAVLYRYRGDGSDLDLPDEEQIYNDAGLADEQSGTESQFSNAITSIDGDDLNIGVEWPDNLIVTNDGVLELSDREDTVNSFRITVPFNVWVPRKSYFKVLYRAVDISNLSEWATSPYLEASETGIVTRLEVVEMETEGKDTESSRTYSATLKTDDKRLADGDTALDDHLSYLEGS